MSHSLSSDKGMNYWFQCWLLKTVPYPCYAAQMEINK